MLYLYKALLLRYFVSSGFEKTSNNGTQIRDNFVEMIGCIYIWIIDIKLCRDDMMCVDIIDVYSSVVAISSLCMDNVCHLDLADQDIHNIEFMLWLGYVYIHTWRPLIIIWCLTLELSFLGWLREQNWLGKENKIG